MNESPVAVHKKIATYAKTASPDVRHIEKPLKMRKINGQMHPEWVRQGDVMLIHIARLPADAVAVKVAGQHQLAPGTTQGSRHMLHIAPGIKVYADRAAGPLSGGYIVATERCYVSHPEHAHMDLPPGTYAVTYQRDLSADEIRAVRD